MQEPLFFLGCSSPALALQLGALADGVVISYNTIEHRVSDLLVGPWILDSGAFTRVTRRGGHVAVEVYAAAVLRWSRCGQLLAAVAQDWMCEALALARTGLTVADHQRLTIEHYDKLLALVKGAVPIMPVLQGYRVYEYLAHLADYGDRLAAGAWVGVGSVCRRNGRPDEILDILASIKLQRPDLRLHGFGLKQLALEDDRVRALLHSADTMAYTYGSRYGDDRPTVEQAESYMQGINAALAGQAPDRTPRTAGAGNGQGRKPLWHSPTKAMRLPARYEEQIIAYARALEAEEFCTQSEAAQSSKNSRLS
jgi:hypothetical protein